MKKLILIIIIFGSLCAFSQKQPVYYDAYQSVKKNSLKFNLGPTLFHGDADQGKPGGAFVGLGYKYSFSPAFGICVGGNIGLLKSSRNKRTSKYSFSGFYNSWDSEGKGDDYDFKNKFWNLDMTAQLVMNNLSFVRKPRPWHFYLLAGVGFMHNNTEGTLKGRSKQSLFSGNRNNSDTIFLFKGYNTHVPFGFGISKKINNRFDIGFEYRYNVTRKDLIDAFSFAVWSNRTFDSYSLLGLHGSYKFGKTDNEQHMDWINPTQKIVEEGENAIADSDSDGVADKFDAEPATPKGIQVYGNGVAIDSDGDKVPDYRDDEKLSPCDQVDENGKVYDMDGDGVPDCKDEEFDTPAGSLVDRTGRKLEIKSGASGGVGSCCDCNDVTLPSVFVDEDNEFRPEAFVAIYLIGNKMQQCPDLSIDIIGYYGMNKSSEQSARTKTNVVIEYLVTYFGISRSKFYVQTKPETMGGKYSKQRIDIKAKK